MRQHLKFLYGFIVILLVSCHLDKETTIVTSNAEWQEQPRSINKKQTAWSEYYIQWGEMVVPLKKYANPNGYTGEVSVSLEDFWASACDKVQLYKNNKLLAAEVQYINLKNRRYNPLWTPTLTDGRGLLSEAVIERMRKEIWEGQEVAISLSANEPDLYISGATIKIINPYAPYRPEKTIAYPKEVENDTYQFQIINKERETIVRLDTTNKEIKHIYDLYRKDKSNYMVHVPEFKTVRRLISKEDILFHSNEIPMTMLLEDVPNVMYLPEYTDFDVKTLEMHWGLMIAPPSSENYLVEAFREECQQDITLSIDKENYPILGMELIIAPLGKSPKRFIAQHVRHPEIQAALEGVTTQSSVYFTNLIIQDKNKKIVHLPVHFAFNIDKPAPYTINITKGNNAAKAVFYEKSQAGKQEIVFENYPLSEMVAWFLEENPDNIRYNYFKEDTINVRFESDIVHLEYGKQVLKKELQREFVWSYYLPFDDEMFSMTVEDDVKLTSVKTTRKDKDWGWGREGNWVTFKHIKLHELVRFLSQRFRTLVLNDTSNLEEVYEINVNVSSFEAMRQQLYLDYGIKLHTYPRTIDAVVFQFDNG